jgi:tRNA(fMet)-specific endonuclease VapC
VTKILLDTNAHSGFMAGDQRVFDAIVESRDVYVSTIVIGELFAGFRGGTRFQENKLELKQFLSKPGVQIIEVSMETAEIFGEIKNALRTKGTMIPLNDIWIAAHTIETGSKLITFDLHFRTIAGLRVWEQIGT